MDEFRQYFLWPLLATLIATVTPLVVVGLLAWKKFAKEQLHTHRMVLFAELMGNRHDILGDNFTSALNRIFVLFHDDPSVIRAVRDFTHATRSQQGTNPQLVRIFRSICKNLDIQDRDITDGDFETVFNPRIQELVAEMTAGIPNQAPESVVLVAKPKHQSGPVYLTHLDRSSLRKLIGDLGTLGDQIGPQPPPH